MNHHAHRSRPLLAFTLVETVLSTVIISVLIVGALATVGSSARTQYSAFEDQHAWSLAEDWMAEILTKPYLDPQTDSGAIGIDGAEAWTDDEERDDIDDYDGVTRTPSGRSGWTMQATVHWIDPDTLAKSASDTGLKYILIQVRGSSGRPVSMVALRSMESAIGTVPTSSRNAFQTATLTLQVGSDASAALTTGMALLNRVDAVTVDATTEDKLVDVDVDLGLLKVKTDGK